MYELKTKQNNYEYDDTTVLKYFTFTTQLLKWKKSTHCSVHSLCLFLILECSM